MFISKNLIDYMGAFSKSCGEIIQGFSMNIGNQWGCFLTASLVHLKDSVETGYS